MSYSTNEFKTGLKILLDGDPYSIVENEFVKPGKGQAFNRVKVRNLKTGRILDKTFKSGESVPAADVMEVEMQYLYYDGALWHFMDPNTYEQCAMPAAVMGEAAKWIKENFICAITTWDQTPILVTPPNFVELEVMHTEPGVKGNTATGGSKQAILETDAEVRVPLFINTGERIKIDTRTGKYVSRA